MDPVLPADAKRRPPSWRFTRKTYLANTAYHVFSRRPDGALMFRDDQDRHSLVSIPQRSLAKVPEAAILAYCLMPTHYHFVIHQADRVDAMTELMRSAMGVYTRQFNRRHNRSGPLCAERFSAVMVETPRQLGDLIAYVHANPAEHTDPFEYPWSSHGLYMSPRDVRREHWCDAKSGLNAFQSRAHYLERLHIAIRRRKLRARSGAPDELTGWR